MPCLHLLHVGLGKGRDPKREDKPRAEDAEDAKGKTVIGESPQ